MNVFSYIIKSLSLNTNNPTGDAFGRLRVSNPISLFDSKQINDNAPLFWDEALVSGAGITSSWDKDKAGSTITSTLNTAGSFIRQTFMSFNYQSGKSQKYTMTGNLNVSGGGTGTEVIIGQINDDNGTAFVYKEGTTAYVRLRSKVTGSVVDTDIVQSEWNLDAMDGSGQSKITINWNKSQIFIIDYEWLAVGRVRFGMNVDGITIYVHEIYNANLREGAYMSTPNLPLRYQLITTASSPATSMLAICSEIVSEGGSEDLGLLKYISTDGNHIDANSAGTIYAVLGYKLKSTHIGAVVKTVTQTMISETNDDFEWIIILNPTIAGTFSYVDETNASIQVAKGSLTNTVTGGTRMDGGFSKSSITSTEKLSNALYIGNAIDGTLDEMVLCVRPLSANADIQATLTLKDLS